MRRKLCYFCLFLFWYEHWGYFDSVSFLFYCWSPIIGCYSSSWDATSYSLST